MIDDAKEILRRSYRILAIAVVLLVAGYFVWFRGDSNVEMVIPEDRSHVTQAQPLLSNYPAPSTFQRFSYGAAELTKQNVLEVGGKCEDAFFTILVFPSAVDYRADPSVAVVNKAFPCPANKNIEYTLKLSELPSLQPGSYYLIVADQPLKGLWYNPR